MPMAIVAVAQQLLYAATAAAYALLGSLLVMSPQGGAVRALLGIGCAATVLWATAGAIGLAPQNTLLSNSIELLQAGSWCALLIYLLQRQFADRRRAAGLIGGMAAIVGFAVAGVIYASASRQADKLVFLGHLGIAVYGCFLADNLYRLTPPDRRWHVNLLLAAFAGIFGYDLVLYADALLYGRLSPAFAGGRPIVSLMAAPLLAVAAVRNRDWLVDIHVSRDAVYHTGSLIVAAAFLLGLAMVGETVRLFGPDWGALVELALVAGGAVSVVVLLTTGSVRSRLRHLLVDNFFSHRYDYRKEWLRCITALSAVADDGSPALNIIRALAETSDSPGGQLWLRDPDGSAYHWVQSWNMAPACGAEPADGRFAAGFRDGGWVIEFGAGAARPDWLGATDVWLAVPLNYLGRLVGYVLLLPPRAPAKPDREVFDLLRIIGRQAAATAVEWQHRRAISETRQLRDFGNRFAFAIHDMKNVASQLQMILQNSVHAGQDPEFQRDVLATVESALDRINAIVCRLRPPPAQSTAAVSVPLDIVEQELEAIRRTRGVAITVRHDGHHTAAAIDGELLRSVVSHLCDNAIEAADGRVEVSVWEDGASLFIDIVDEGDGMTAEFVRDRLFTPFGSTKDNGLGIGAYQARELIRTVGGDILVQSRPGLGTRMRVALPCLAQVAEDPVFSFI